MSDMSGHRACGILANDSDGCVSSKAMMDNKLNLMHAWRPLYTPVYFDLNPVVFVCCMLSLRCAHAAADSPPCV